jgi:imidazolonepropionase-like amidohydrolase
MSSDQPDRIVIRDVSVLDATGREPEGRGDVLVEAGRISAVGRVGELASGVAVVDGAGTTLLPGLTDAHVHFALIGTRGDHGTDTWIGHVLTVAGFIEGALQEGFTTVRDAGGLGRGREGRSPLRAAHPAVGFCHLADRRPRR